MGFLWWGDDDEEAAKFEQAKQDSIAAAREYVSTEKAKIEAEYQSKYQAAETKFSDISKQLSEKESSLNEYAGSLKDYAGSVDNTISLFNQAGQAASVAAANNGTPQKYSVATQPLDPKGPSTLLLGAAALLAYFYFFHKRS